MPESNRQKKTVLITGGSGGVGRASAERFLEDGHRVVIADVNANNLGEALKALADLPQGDAARFIYPQEVANLCTFLAGDHAAAMTGAPVHLDFGTTAGVKGI